MNLLDLLSNQYVSIIAGGLGGVLTAWLTQRVVNRRGVFTYFVSHNRVGMSTEDAIFGTVAVSWNGKPITNLYLSTIEMKNESLNDYENVVICAYTSDTKLMTEQTQILDTPKILEWSEQYGKKQHVEPGQEPTEQQWNMYNGQREYIIPTLNRGQSIKLTYLNSATGTGMPSIWLSTAQKGVKLKFRAPQNQILGVPQNRAALLGVLLGIAVAIVLAWYVANTWVVAIVALSYGLIAQVPGAYMVKLLRYIREAVGG